MRGRVIKRGPWYSIIFDVGRDPVTGKRKQKRISEFGTRKEAEAELAKHIAEIERGTYLDPGRKRCLAAGSAWQDTGSHVMPTMQHEAVELLERNLFSRMRKGGLQDGE